MDSRIWGRFVFSASLQMCSLHLCCSLDPAAFGPPLFWPWPQSGSFWSLVLLSSFGQLHLPSTFPGLPSHPTRLSVLQWFSSGAALAPHSSLSPFICASLLPFSPTSPNRQQTWTDATLIPAFPRPGCPKPGNPRSMLIMAPKIVKRRSLPKR